MTRPARPNPLNDAEQGVPQQEPYAVNIPLQIAPSTSWVSEAGTVNTTTSSTSATSEPPAHAIPPAPKPKASDYPKTEPPIPEGTAVEVKEVSRPRPVLTPKHKLKYKSQVSRWIRWQLWFNTYRKFFTVVITFNLVSLFLAIAGVWDYPRRYTGAMVLGNLYVAILIRNEAFGRLLYLLVNTLFAKWPPLQFRLGCTSALQHLGGIHSGCATSGCIWLLYRVVTILINHRINHSSVLVMGVITNIIVMISIASAFPWVRNTHHNIFERHHRFMGWLGLIATWIFVILGDSYDPATHTWNPDGLRIVRSQDFWFALGMTIFVLIPWFTIREVKVDVEIPSPKVAILRFRRGMQQGLLARISRSSIMEYHAFGIISEGKHADYHYLICGVQGDFTRSLVERPPTRIWTRELKFAGVSNTSTLYRRGIRVCTGTGLGAALSTCIQNPNCRDFSIEIDSRTNKTFVFL
ncbi:nonribosomal peptide synthetase 12 [Coprinopsis cinerea AmutBmut pab1-1]|nr:nonribosomal peptide synthetase 12 [Coprinopsis cinerea AmutBmut pab1-1]